MRFHLQVELDDAATPETTTRELSRILRYWAGNLHHYDLTPGTTEDIHDSTYAKAGSWTITD
ncbi:hypothetical protein [Streptomyces longispororuber]|nr:hypothetical protein [Streptomyces longispororuber]